MLVVWGDNRWHVQLRIAEQNHKPFMDIFETYYCLQSQQRGLSAQLLTTE